MKEVQIIIRPNLYQKTKEKLIEKNFYCISVKDILGRGKRPGNYEIAHADGEKRTIVPDFVAKKFIDIYVSDEDVDELIQTVLEVNSTHTCGDGKIFVLDAEKMLSASGQIRLEKTQSTDFKTKG